MLITRMACACLCFPPSAQVWTKTGSEAIADLKSGEKVETVGLDKRGRVHGLKSTPFYTYIHFEPERHADFLTLKCDNGAQLTLTGSHLLFKCRQNGSYKPVLASSISIGDSLGYLTGHKEILPLKVNEIGTVSMRGVYAPLTKSGTLIVDGFLVSCYAEVESHSAAHALLAPIRFAYGEMSQALERSQIQVSRTKDGMNRYVKFLLNFGNLLPSYLKV